MRTGFWILVVSLPIFSGACSPGGSASDEPSQSGGSAATGGGNTGGLGGGASIEECKTLSESQCAATDECSSIFGYTGLSGEGKTYVGCRYSGPPDDQLTCGDAIVCGYPADDEDQCKIFTDDCIPSDWTPVTSCSDVSSCPDPQG